LPALRSDNTEFDQKQGVQVVQRILIIAAVLMANGIASAQVFSDTSQQSVLRLRSQVSAASRSVTLAEVADLSAAPELQARLAATVVLESAGADLTTEFTYDDLIAQLDAAGVNRAAVMVTGALSCTISFPESSPVLSEPETQAASTRSSVFRVDARQPDARSAGSLAEHVRAHFRQEFAGAGGEVDLRFERVSDAFLNLTSPPYEFSLRTSGRGQLGPRQVRVTIRRDGRTQRTIELYVQVRLVKEVPVAKRALNVGTMVRTDDLRLEPHIFERREDMGASDVNLLVGQQVRQFVPAGALLGSDAVKSVDLVKRSRPVTLVGMADGVQATMTGVALDSGELGDEVRVRLGDRKTGRRVLRGKVTGVGTVRLIGH
jgi:flagella basal body P-ring formation protein FlgA